MNRSKQPLIVIEYWHESAAFAHLLEVAIADQIPDVQVFAGAGPLRSGETFRDPAQEIVERCDVLFILIGPDALTRVIGRGLSWGDPIGRLIETARQHQRPIVAILHDGVSASDLGRLPGVLRVLARRMPLEINSGTLATDLPSLRDSIEDLTSADE